MFCSYAYCVLSIQHSWRRFVVSLFLTLVWRIGYIFQTSRIVYICKACEKIVMLVCLFGERMETIHYEHHGCN